jgi:hypothetical protein
MRLPRVRCSVRVMLVAVAVAGVLFYGAVLCRRRALFLRKAAEHGDWEKRYRVITRIHREAASEKDDLAKKHLAKLDGLGVSKDSREQTARVRDQISRLFASSKSYYLQEAEWTARIAAYYTGLRQKYENAALRPWIAVAPDPPEPSR